MTTTTPSIQDRIAALDWAAMTRDFDSFGCTIVKSVLTREECRSLAALLGNLLVEPTATRCLFADWSKN